MTTSLKLGVLVRSFFEDFLIIQKGLRTTSIQSYRDVLRLFLAFIAKEVGRRITQLSLQDLTFERVLQFLEKLEKERKNSVRTRNHRLAALHVFFEYLAGREPQMLMACQKVAAIPTKRTPPPETQFLEPEQIAGLIKGIADKRQHAHRDRVLLLFLHNTGARVQEVADLRFRHLELESPTRVRLHGKGDKWRVCPLWDETARQIKLLLEQQKDSLNPDNPVFLSNRGQALTRFGIYKIVRRYANRLESDGKRHISKHISPHTFRHSAAMHLLESGVEVNVIRGWLGHVSLETTNRYVEIGIRAKENALRVCQPPVKFSERFHSKNIWKDDQVLLDWLNSL